MSIKDEFRYQKVDMRQKFKSAVFCIIPLLQNSINSSILIQTMNSTYNLASHFRSCQSSHHYKPSQIDFNVHMSNIFKTQQLQRFTEKGFISSKHYEVVGIKELKNLELRTRKGTKLGTRRHEDTLERPISKQSSNNKHQLLTKEEVLQCLPKLDKPKDLVKIKKKSRRNSQISQYDDKLTSKVVKTSRIKNEFSVSRLKGILKQRENEWIQLQNKEKSHKRDNQKFPTIYKSIELYRSKLQEKERGQQVDSTIAKNYTQWQHSLRKKNSGREQISTEKSVERIFHDDGQLSAKGSSKLKLETEWIENKDKDGYQFKLISQQVVPKKLRSQRFR